MKSVTVQYGRIWRPGLSAAVDLGARKIPSQFNVLLVGAQGFEPWTCSTQNCRATRLRYTPISAGNGRRYTLGTPPARRWRALAKVLITGAILSLHGVVFEILCSGPAVERRTGAGQPVSGC